MLLDLQTFLQDIFDSQSPWISILVLLIFIVGAVIAHAVSFSVLHRISRRSTKDDFRKAIVKLKSPALLLFIVMSIIIALPIISLDELLEDNVQHALSILIIITISWFLIQGIAVIRDIILERYDIEEKDNLKARKAYTQFRMLERILIFLIVIIAIATALMTFETIRQVGISILASAGIAGIILGFAAQRLIATILAGFQIAITQPIRIDDVVVVEGEFGWIEEVTLTYVVIRIWDKRRLVVPTIYFIEKPFQNWTRVSSDILGSVFLYVDYSVPVDVLREELTRILETYEKWDKQVNVLQVTNSTEKVMELRALMSATDAPTAWDLRVHVREKLIQFLQENYPAALPKNRVQLEQDKQFKNSENPIPPNIG